MFSQASVILFTEGGGVCPLGRHPPRADTPRADTTPGQTPPGRHPLGRHPPPGQTVTAVDGTHPTGMHSCRICIHKYVLHERRDKQDATLRIVSS